MADDIKLPEPVAYCLGSPHFADSADLYLASQYTPDGEHADEWTPLYTADQVRAAVEADRAQRKPLTDEQIDGLHGEANRGYCIERDDYFKAFRDAERAHGIPSPKGGE